MKKIFLVVALLMVTAASSFAQRTVIGQSFVSGDFGMSLKSAGVQEWPGKALAFDVEYGHYTRLGYWGAGVGMANQLKKLTDYELNLPYTDISAYGQYMFRITGTRSRSVNLYGGGGAGLGLQIMDMGNYCKDYEFTITRKEYSGGETKTVTKTLSSGDIFFLLHIFGNIEGEFFFAPKVAFVLRASVGVSPLTSFDPLILQATGGFRFDI